MWSGKNLVLPGTSQGMHLNLKQQTTTIIIIIIIIIIINTRTISTLFACYIDSQFISVFNQLDAKNLF